MSYIYKYYAICGTFRVKIIVANIANGWTEEYFIQYTPITSILALHNPVDFSMYGKELSRSRLFHTVFFI